MGTIFIEDFIENPNQLFYYLKDNVSWDTQMKSCDTASFGVPYNYSGIEYPAQKIIPELERITIEIEDVLGWKPNNCLLNYYPNGNSKMGYHSDNTEILEKNTGVVIVSVGATRILNFKHKKSREVTGISLTSGSFFYMDDHFQEEYLHAINKSDNPKGRISLTFRKIKPK